jgi:hypothetical protein
VDVALGERPGQRHRPLGIDRRAHHEHGSWLEVVDRTVVAVGPEKHRLGLRGVDDDADQHVGLGGQVGHRRMRGPTLCG